MIEYGMRVDAGTAEAGLKEPVFSLDNEFKLTIYRSEQISEQVGEQVSEQVQRLLQMMAGAMSTKEMMEAAAIASRRLFKEKYLDPAIEAGLVVMTDPDRPNSPKQKYRLTKKGNKYKGDL